MTDIPDTNTLKGMLAEATPGPWHEDHDPVYPDKISIVSEDLYIALVDFCNRQAANASLIALAPSLAARVIELEAEVANLRAAIHEASHPDFLWGALDNVHDAETTLDDYAAAASRAIRAALEDGQ